MYKLPTRVRRCVKRSKEMWMGIIAIMMLTAVDGVPLYVRM